MNTTVVGTSQAAAHVAGLAAYLLSTSKDLTPATVGEAITILAVLDLPVVSRTCWRSTTRRPADHLPTEGTPIVGSADYAAAFALVAQQRLQTPTTTDDLATDLASQDLADRIAHFAGAGLLDTDNPRLAADHFSALTVLLAYERQPIPATANPEKVRQTMADGAHAFIRAYATRWERAPYPREDGVGNALGGTPLLDVSEPGLFSYGCGEAACVLIVTADSAIPGSIPGSTLPPPRRRGHRARLDRSTQIGESAPRIAGREEAGQLRDRLGRGRQIFTRALKGRAWR
ncbi:S8 family serine peptidase [Streptomyces mirabilis]|uniref:S8 family serine peptidase n=1 Tax=Streptomyces mirabilis TaxID=68239 RepID=UPI00365E923D